MSMDSQIPVQNGDIRNAASSIANHDRDGDGSALIFLGTGCSSAVPNAMCLIRPSDPPCHVCSQALSLPPERNRNYRFNLVLTFYKICFALRFGLMLLSFYFQLCLYLFSSYLYHRCNTSLLVDYCHGDKTHSYILIDVGKTFREQVLRWFTFHRIPRVDSVSFFFFLQSPVPYA